MGKFIYENGRTGIGKPDITFGVSARANARIGEIGKENVINSTIGTLMDDSGKLIVLESVTECIKSLSAADFAAYAPITGIPQYIDAVKKAIFPDGLPSGITMDGGYAPGGTGALRNAVSAYTKPGESFLVHDWMWAPYRTIAEEIGRKVTTFELFTPDNTFNLPSFKTAVEGLLGAQEQLLILLNSPANNPTGYSLTLEDWDGILNVFKEHPNKRFVVLCDIAYIDFAGDKKTTRAFLYKLAGEAPTNVLPLIAFSASKTFTMYGMRCGALMAMSRDPEVVKEFKDVLTVECRASWSNGNRSAMTVVSKILFDEKLMKKVDEEREVFKALLARRGKAFTEEAEKIGLKTCPYDSGFFALVPTPNAKAVCEKLEEENVFTIPMGAGVRISVASIREDECRILPAKILEAMKAVE